LFLLQVKFVKQVIATVDDFDSRVGLAYLKGMHINDSKTGLNSKRDRHENIGLYVKSHPVYDQVAQGAPAAN
jgi:endonuclease IV